jgi:hypothetical protein
MEWAQAVGAYLSLASQSKRYTVMNKERTALCFPELKGATKTPTIDELKVLFVGQLKAKQTKGNALDLHGLDHQSAGILLDGVFEENKALSIIYGSASHSKSSENKMRALVESKCRAHQFDAVWDSNSALVRVSPKPRAALGFFEQAVKEPAKPSGMSWRFNPNAVEFKPGLG